MASATSSSNPVDTLSKYISYSPSSTESTETKSTQARPEPKNNQEKLSQLKDPSSLKKVGDVATRALKEFVRALQTTFGNTEALYHTGNVVANAVNLANSPKGDPLRTRASRVNCLLDFLLLADSLSSFLKIFKKSERKKMLDRKEGKSIPGAVRDGFFSLAGIGGFIMLARSASDSSSSLGFNAISTFVGLGFLSNAFEAGLQIKDAMKKCKILDANDKQYSLRKRVAVEQGCQALVKLIGSVAVVALQVIVVFSLGPAVLVPVLGLTSSVLLLANFCWSARIKRLEKPLGVPKSQWEFTEENENVRNIREPEKASVLEKANFLCETTCNFKMITKIAEKVMEIFSEVVKALAELPLQILGSAGFLHLKNSISAYNKTACGMDVVGRAADLADDKKQIFSHRDAKFVATSWLVKTATQTMAFTAMLHEFKLIDLGNAMKETVGSMPIFKFVIVCGTVTFSAIDLIKQGVVLKRHRDKLRELKNDKNNLSKEQTEFTFEATQFSSVMNKDRLLEVGQTACSMEIKNEEIKMKHATMEFVATALKVACLATIIISTILAFTHIALTIALAVTFIISLSLAVKCKLDKEYVINRLSPGRYQLSEDGVYTQKAAAAA